MIEPFLIDSYGLDPRKILDAISRSNRLIAAGELDAARKLFNKSADYSKMLTISSTCH